jgi:uncharacterized membrane protein YdjX (TVP38/TMEM64 family)
MVRLPAWLRIGLIAAIVIGTLATVVLESAREAEWIHDRLDDLGPLLPLGYLLAHVVASLAFVPRSVMAIVAAALWGFWAACAWSLIGATGGALAGFLLARYVNAGLVVPEEMKRIGPLLERAERGGWRTVMTVRLIPVLPHALTNYTFGLTRVSLRDYALGSFLGLLPHTIIFVNLGLSGRRALEGGAWLEPMLWGFGLLALSLVVPKLLPRRPSDTDRPS